MASPLTIQPSSKDNFIVAGLTINFGSQPYLDIGYNDLERALVEFAITWGTTIPAGAIITAATLYLYYYSYNEQDPVGRTYYAERLLRTDWHETQSTWYIFKTSNNWTTAGANSDGNDYTSTHRAQAVVPASAGWMSWNVLDIIKDFQTAGTSPAFRLKDSIATPSKGARFYSNNYTDDTSLCPKLVITYYVSTTVNSSVIIGDLATASRLKNAPRSASVKIGKVASASKSSAITRNASVAIGIKIVAYLIYWVIQAAVSIGVAVNASKTSGFVKSALVLIGKSVSASRTVGYIRHSAGSIIGIVASSIKATGLHKLSAVAIGIVASAAKAFGYTRLASVKFGVVVTSILWGRKLIVQLFTSAYRNVKSFVTNYRNVKVISTASKG